jgi:hypothetical protein
MKFHCAKKTMKMSFDSSKRTNCSISYAPRKRCNDVDALIRNLSGEVVLETTIFLIGAAEITWHCESAVQRVKAHEEADHYVAAAVIRNG